MLWRDPLETPSSSCMLYYPLRHLYHLISSFFSRPKPNNWLWQNQVSLSRVGCPSTKKQGLYGIEFPPVLPSQSLSNSSVFWGILFYIIANLFACTINSLLTGHFNNFLESAELSLSNLRILTSHVMQTQCHIIKWFIPLLYNLQ